MFVFFIYLWNFGKISIFLASAGSFNVKNDNFHSFFFAVLVANVEFASFAPKQKYTDWTVPMKTFPWKRSVLQSPDRERTNQSTGICLGLGLPYNKRGYYSQKVFLLLLVLSPLNLCPLYVCNMHLNLLCTKTTRIHDIYHPCFLLHLYSSTCMGIGLQRDDAKCVKICC